MYAYIWIVKKYSEINLLLYDLFANFSEAFDSVNCEAFGKLLSEFGCLSSFINLIECFNGGVRAMCSRLN